MKILSLEVENFGPYFGVQSIDLATTKTARIILIHGENMRGKTTILNAIKWCLYGRVTTQVAHQVLADEGFASYVARDKGHEFTVGAKMAISHANENFTFHRHFRCQRNDALPDEVLMTKAPKLHVVSDKRGVITSDEANDLIAAMLPEDLSGLFFFDGESLGELQRSVESSSGSAILRNRIERILGMPAFTESIEATALLRKEVSKRIQEMNKVSKKQEESSTRLKQSEDELARQKLQRQGVVSFLDTARRKIVEIEPIFRANALLIENEKRYEEAKADLRELDERITMIKLEIRDLLDRGFWVCLGPRIESLRDSLETQIQEAQMSMVKDSNVLGNARVEKMLASGRCDTCRHSLNEDEIVSLRERSSATSEIGQIPEVVQDLISKNKQLRSFLNSDSQRKRIEDLDKDLRETILKKEYKVRQVSDLQRLLEESGESGSSIEKEYVDAKLSQEEGESTLSAIDNQIVNLEAGIRSIEGTMSDGVDDPQLKNRGKILSEVEELLLTGLKSFERSIRLRVMEVASTVFGRLTSESKYAGLRIDNDYNLKIIDQDDRVIQKRSAGAEQIVAMSLVGALAHCAVNDAPVLIDTPFGRLDSVHRRNVVAWLPELADQVILFVTSGEFDEDIHRALLKDQIAEEYDLVPVSHIETTIRSR